MSCEHKLNTVNGALNDRINALLDGNCIEPNSVSLQAARSERISVAIRAEVTLGWETEWHRLAGCSNPEDAVHCNDRSEVQNVATQELDVQIRSEVETRAVQQKWSNGSLGLLEWNKPSFTIRKFDHKWYCHEKCQSCRGRGEVRCDRYGCYLGKVDCTSCCGKGTTTFVAGVPARTHIMNCAVCYGSGKTNCWTCNGSCWVNCHGCDATGWFTLINEGKITASLSKTIDTPPPENDGGQHLLALPIETLVRQGDVELARAGVTSGQVSFEYRVTVLHVVNTYRNQDRKFEVHGIGRDLLVPKMPTFLDDCIKPVADHLILATNNHEGVLRSANGCVVTKTILLALGTKSNCKPTDFVAQFENAVSLDLIERLLTALTLAYNGCGSFAVRRIWLKGTLALNVGIAACVLLGVPELLIRMENANAPGGSQGLVLCTTAVILASIWLTARHAALKAARTIAGENISRPPSQGVLPIALCAMTFCGAYFVSEAGNRVGKPFAKVDYTGIHASSASPISRSPRN